MAEALTETPDEEEKRLTREIIERARRIGELRSREEPFVPGKSAVKYAGRVYDAHEMANLAASATEFWLTAGKWHRRLENDLARYYGLAHARLVNSGSSANLVAVAQLMSPKWGDRRLHPGDEIITVAAGFPTTVAPMIQLGLVPVFVDVTLPTANVDVSQLEAALSPRTRAVFIAHTLGNPFDVDAVLAFCTKHDLRLLEDNCDASGSRYKGRMTGTFGEVSTLSFYPPHHMTTGEGGALLTNSDDMQLVVESLRDWGRDCWCASGVDNTCGKRFEHHLGTLPYGYDHKYTYSHLGYNLKMTDMQAAVGHAQLAKLDGFGAARRANWRFFRDAFAEFEDVFVLPEATAGADPSWFGFFVVVRDEAGFKRDAIVAHLEAKRIQTRMLFAGNLVRQPALHELAETRRARGEAAPFRTPVPLETTDRIMRQGFWLGVYPGLTEPMKNYVVETVQGFVRERHTQRHLEVVR